MAKKENNTHTYKNGEYWTTEENLKKIEDWARKGLVLEDVAHNMGIHISTLYDMKKKHPQINDAYIKGKREPDLKVFNAYHQLALGHTTKEEVYVKDPDTGEMVLERIIVKDIPPNEKAASTWIKNRMPHMMKDNQLTETYKAKLEAETALIKAKVSLLQGDSKDSSHLNALISLFDGMKEKE